MLVFLASIPLAVLAWSILKGMVDGAGELGGEPGGAPSHPFLPDFGDRAAAK